MGIRIIGLWAEIVAYYCPSPRPYCTLDVLTGVDASLHCRAVPGSQGITLDCLSPDTVVLHFKKGKK